MDRKLNLVTAIKLVHTRHRLHNELLFVFVAVVFALHDYYQLHTTSLNCCYRTNSINHFTLFSASSLRYLALIELHYTAHFMSK